jgi:hypothetical protein
LDPCTLCFKRPAEGERHAETYTVDVKFSSHCFTRAPKDGEVYDYALVYPHDDYERRLFDFQRYELSKRLPAVILGLPARKPYHNKNRRNYFSIEIVTENGVRLDYEIFFKVRKIAKGRLELIVETGFVRDPAHESSRPKGKPIRFWIILFNTLHNLPIRA